jgi:hypothetical protein
VSHFRRLLLSHPLWQAYAKEVGAKGKTKDVLLRELKHMLPIKDQWASSDEDWESVRIPGLNSYGNVDVRDGVHDGWTHYRGLRLCVCYFRRGVL